MKRALGDGETIDARVGLVGTIHKGFPVGAACYAALKGEKLKLIREPTCEYDANAIRVVRDRDERNVGYVMRGAAQALSPALALGAVRCVACECEKDGQTLRLTLEKQSNGGSTELDNILNAALMILEIPNATPEDLSSQRSGKRIKVSSAKFMTFTGADDSPWVTNAIGTSCEAFAKRYPPSSFHENEVAWVYANGKHARYKGCACAKNTAAKNAAAMTGKWMLFTKEVDKFFIGAAVLVDEGEIAGAKTVPGVATKSRPIIMYTNDWSNQKDVERAALAIKKKFGMNVALSYKTDVDTLAGTYATEMTTSAYAMPYNSLQLAVHDRVLRRASDIVRARRSGKLKLRRVIIPRRSDQHSRPSSSRAVAKLPDEDVIVQDDARANRSSELSPSRLESQLYDVVTDSDDDR